MIANLIRSLSNRIEHVEIEAGKSGRENFPRVDFENAVLIINGKIRNPKTKIKENDVVTLRQFPANGDTWESLAKYLLVPFGFAIFPAIEAKKAQEEAEKAKEELEKVKKLTNQPDIANYPFLRGATNTIATGKSQPYLCGRNFVTPYKFTNDYYKISGEDGEIQDVFNVYECGFKGIIFESLGMGDNVIKTFNHSSPQNGTWNINSKLYANGQIEIRQTGALFSTLTDLNYRVVSCVANKELEMSIPAADRLTFQLDPSAMDVDIAINFPYGLYEMNDKNDRIGTGVHIYPQYTLDGGSTWTTFNFSGVTGNHFQRKAEKELRYVAHHDFTFEEISTLKNNGQQCVSVRVWTDAAKSESDRKQKTCYLYYYQSKCYDPAKSSAPAGVLDDSGAAGLTPCLNVEDKERSYSCIMGVRLRSTTSNKDLTDKFNFIATATARIWDGTSWTTSRSATRNPAAIALEILTSSTHLASKYADSEIDLEAFGAFYEYCETNDLKFDYVISQNQKKDDTLQLIADVCNVAFYTDIYARRSVAIDQVQLNALAIYNPQNIISISNKKSFTRRIDALRVKYTASENDVFKENTYTVTRLENGEPVTINKNSIIKEVNVTGITRFSQVVKYARRLMAIDELRQITTTIHVGNEGVYYYPFAKIILQDPSLYANTQDAVIDRVTYQSSKLKKIYLRNPVNFADVNKQYGVLISIPGQTKAEVLPLKVTGSGITTELTVNQTYRQSKTLQPESNFVLSFGELDANGEFGQIAKEFVITKISRVSTGYNLDLVEYNTAIYESGAIPAYIPIQNAIPPLEREEIPADRVTKIELADAVKAGDTKAAQEAIDTINGTRFTNIYDLREPPTSLEDLIAKIDEDAKNASASISVSEAEIRFEVKSLDEQQRALIELTKNNILALVEDLDEQQRAYINLTKSEILAEVEDGDTQQRAYTDTTKDEILAEVDDMAKELSGAIDVQAGAVTALVEGGGASGQMSLSLNLPILINATERAALVAASTESKVNAVYGIVTGTEYYGIKANASNAAVKTLWDDAITAGLLASQIVLSANQINIAGKTIYTSSKTDSEISAAAAAAVSTAAADATTKANAAQSAAEATAAADATAKANAAQTAAETAAAADATSKANAAQTAAETYADSAAADAQSAAESYADTAAADAQSAAESTAAADATTKANAAKNAAISAAASDATTKANTAESNAIAAAALDATTKADAAQAAAISAAASDATTKANAAQAAAISAAATDATNKRNDIAQKLGYANWAAMETAAQNSQTIIDGGYLRTALIDVENILTKNIAVKDKGVIRSNNYNGTIDANGNIIAYGSAGWAIDHAGVADFVNLNATGGSFTDVNVYGRIASKHGFVLANSINTINITHKDLIYNLAVALEITSSDTFQELPRIVFGYISGTFYNPDNNSTYTAAGNVLQVVFTNMGWVIFTIIQTNGKLKQCYAKAGSTAAVIGSCSINF